MGFICYYFVAPFEIWIFCQGAITQLSLKQFVYLVRHDRFQENVQVVEIVLCNIVVSSQIFRG